MRVIPNTKKNHLLLSNVPDTIPSRVEVLDWDVLGSYIAVVLLDNTAGYLSRKILKSTITKQKGSNLLVFYRKKSVKFAQC